MLISANELKKIKSDLLAEIAVEISGLKINQLAGVASVTNQHLFVIADSATGLAYQATQRQVKDAVAVVADFHSCVPTTVPTGAKDGSVYFPIQAGTYTNF